MNTDDLLTPPPYCQYSRGPCEEDIAKELRAFATVLYPSEPEGNAATIEAAVTHLRERDPSRVWRTWRELRVAGQVVFCAICKGMRSSSMIVADVTRLNFNLMFEIGFALGLEQPVLPIRDTSILTDDDNFRALGLLDTLGYLDFQNSNVLAARILDRLPVASIAAPRAELNKGQPVYLVKGQIETEGEVRLLSTLKKSPVRFRTLDVVEVPRLSLHEARKQVESSLAVVAHIIRPDRRGALVHNARCALLAGMAMASGKVVLLLSEEGSVSPIDFRDVLVPYKSPDQVPRLLEPFIRQVITRLQDAALAGKRRPERFLEKVDLGDIAAENEIMGLRSYFVRTAQFAEARRGTARLVVGRKGSGKTAIFYQVRDSIPRGYGHMVLDLKPEGHQFTKLREIILARLQPGLQEHTLAAFWHYILLCELAQKISDSDYAYAQRDAKRQERFAALMDVYLQQVAADAGDFSERLLRQVDRLTQRFEERAQGEMVSGAELTEVLFKGEIRALEEVLSPYLGEKDDVWILIDNLDKGWPTRGTRSPDILILRALMEATRKLQRELSKREVDVHCLVFLRNDIYDHLVLETPDRGKDTPIMLDWDDPLVFQELIRQRVKVSTGVDGPFEEVWGGLFEPHVGTQESFRYIVERTLMRPRDLLTFVQRSMGVAINRGHDRVMEDDIRKAEESYSEDVLLNTAWELRDVYPEMLNLLYLFDRCAPQVSRDRVAGIVKEGCPEDLPVDEVIDLLLWFGFLGVIETDALEPRFAYQMRYNLDKLLTPVTRLGAQFVVHPAFRRALSIPSE